MKPTVIVCTKSIIGDYNNQFKICIEYTASFEDGSSKTLHNIDFYSKEYIRNEKLGYRKTTVMERDNCILYKCDWSDVKTYNYEKEYPLVTI